MKFCGECGAAVALVCPACSTPNEAGRKFCGECGAALATSPAPAAASPPAAVASMSERRLVSVLFADLVGFTPLSESREQEDGRDVLLRYIDSQPSTVVL